MIDVHVFMVLDLMLSHVVFPTLQFAAWPLEVVGLGLDTDRSSFRPMITSTNVLREVAIKTVEQPVLITLGEPILQEVARQFPVLHLGPLVERPASLSGIVFREHTV